MSLNIEYLIDKLKNERPIFHSEADFQHALGMLIKEKYPKAMVRLEKRISSIIDKDKTKASYIDIWVMYRNCEYFIELKYKTKKLKRSIGNETYDLKNQAAQPTGRYDYLKDIYRLEKIIKKDQNKIGYSIFLTNDSSYWEKSSKKNIIDYKFRLDEGKVIKKGRLDWKLKPNEGASKNREEFKLAKNYILMWKTYSLLDQKNGHFKLLISKISNF